MIVLGWFIQMIDKEANVRKDEAEKKAKAEKDDEERQQDLINQQVQRYVIIIFICSYLFYFRAKQLLGDQEEYKPTDLIRNDDTEKIELSINFNKKPTIEVNLTITISNGVLIGTEQTHN